LGGAHIHIYSCSALLISFEIDCFYGLRTRIYEYAPPIIELATALQNDDKRLGRKRGMRIVDRAENAVYG
jgi:hypothetical protein